MSVTYTKKLKTITIYTTNNGEVSITDDVDNPTASLALASLQSGHGAYVTNEETLLWIPSSAVVGIAISEDDSEPITVDECSGYSAEDGGGDDEPVDPH